ncbi:hypothetical protein IW146_005551 [Coemansia sp. RSA 922]|nr:hypothetical protein H4S03_003140 [Coemansia sp. S3946]KAJ2074187.1 hypothetical protein GGH13_001486 [Coemansia sp. S155-1]KAJ2111167.1 hypothetical protein IW146_005551 [Coemansia sp. RSA 922]
MKFRLSFFFFFFSSPIISNGQFVQPNYPRLAVAGAISGAGILVVGSSAYAAIKRLWGREEPPEPQLTPTPTRPEVEAKEDLGLPSFPGICPENVDPSEISWDFLRPLAYSAAGGFFVALLLPLIACNQRCHKRPSRIPKRRTQRILPLGLEASQPEAPIPGPVANYTPVLPADGGYPLGQCSEVALAQVNEATNIERHSVAFSELNRVTNGAYSHCRHVPQTTDGLQIYWRRGETTMSLPPFSDCDTESCYSDTSTSERVYGEHYCLDEFGNLTVDYESTQSPREVDQVYIPPDIDLVAEQMRHEDLKLRFVRLWASIAAERNEQEPAPSATTEPIVEQGFTPFEHESDRDSAYEERVRDASKSIFSRLPTSVAPARDPPEPLPGEAIGPVVERTSTTPSVGVNSQLLPVAPQPSDYAADGPSNRSCTPSSSALGELRGQEPETSSAVPGRGAPQPPLEETVGLGVGQDSAPNDSTPNDQAVPGPSKPNRATASSVPSNRRGGKPKRQRQRSRRH